MNSTVSTCNMAEALYLLRRGNRVVKVRLAWPYGLEECALVFEGESAEGDHDLEGHDARQEVAAGGTADCCAA